ncbi:glycosyltransferase [Leptolyngbya sp. 7M]|uniref:glycosyltransferase n=1 Tax=Leptolyngbya sp. 7M TaxID=2812896 RepID=UPI001B8D13DE|nr:glycosyltransferase [Leptolyngbya sp. 7M]QYO67459.1 glycosyltransferase [Leptolyngbya sp. 7M]
MSLGFDSQIMNKLRASVASLRTTVNFLDLADLENFWKQVEQLADKFDWQFYCGYYDDLSHLSNSKEALEHWIVFGQFEGRLPNQEALEAQFKLKKLSLPEDFDAEKYWILNPDLQKQFAKNQYTEFKLIEHFLQYGKAEGRPYQTYFDWKFYLEYNDDLTYLTTSEIAYEHWLTVGQLEGRFASEAELVRFLQQKQIDLPSKFDFNVYLSLNPDLQIKFSDHKYKQYKATEHFLNQGKLSGRHYSYDCLLATESPASQSIQQKTIELYSALFNPHHYLQQCSSSDKPSSNCLIHLIQKNIENYHLLNKELQCLVEAVVFYRLALQLQPGSAEVVTRLNGIVNYGEQFYQHNCSIYPCDDDVYAQWLRENSPNANDLWQMAKAVADFSYKPLISIILPVYNTPEPYLREALQSVLNQIYPYWELCIADDQSTQAHVRSILEEYAAQDSRIKLLFRSTNGHISACSNSALTLATGEFVTFLDHDDIITPDALYEVAVSVEEVDSLLPFFEVSADGVDLSDDDLLE